MEQAFHLHISTISQICGGWSQVHSCMHHQSYITPDKVAPLDNNAGGLDSSLGGDGLGVQGVDVFAGRQNAWVADGVASWAWLHIATLYTQDRLIDATNNQQPSYRTTTVKASQITLASSVRQKTCDIAVHAKHAKALHSKSNGKMQLLCSSHACPGTRWKQTCTLRAWRSAPSSLSFTICSKHDSR